jgi:hypothetical protein
MMFALRTSESASVVRSFGSVSESGICAAISSHRASASSSRPVFTWCRLTRKSWIVVFTPLLVGLAARAFVASSSDLAGSGSRQWA